MDVDTWNTLSRNERIAWLDENMKDETVCQTLDFMASAYPNFSSMCEAARLLAETGLFKQPTQPRRIESVASYYYYIDGGGIETALKTLSSSLGEREGQIRSSIIAETFDSPWADGQSGTTLPDVLALDELSGKSHFDKLAQALTSLRPEALIYHAWCSSNLLWDVCLCKALGIRAIVNVHGIFSHFLAANDGSRDHWHDESLFTFVPLVARLCDAIVCQSTTGRDFFGAFCARSFAIAHRLPDPYPELATRKRTRAKNRCNLLWVGRIEPYKHPEDALEAFAKLQKRIPDATLTFVGQFESAEYERELQNKAAELNIATQVAFAGFEPDVSGRYHDADALLCTTEIEGYCMVIAEACACGTPVVAFELPYLPFARCEGITWVPQGDTDAAAAALEALLDDDAAWECASAEEQRFMRDDLQRILPDTWGDVLESLAGGDWPDRRTESSTLIWDTLFAHLVKGEERVHSRIERLERRAQASEALAEELRTSYSYRVGHALLALPRAIRQLASRRHS